MINTHIYLNCLVCICERVKNMREFGMEWMTIKRNARVGFAGFIKALIYLQCIMIIIINRNDILFHMRMDACSEALYPSPGEVECRTGSLVSFASETRNI